MIIPSKRLVRVSGLGNRQLKEFDMGTPPTVVFCYQYMYVGKLLLHKMDDGQPWARNSDTLPES
jgi:hypothetical protein